MANGKKVSWKNRPLSVLKELMPNPSPAASGGSRSVAASASSTEPSEAMASPPGRSFRDLIEDVAPLPEGPQRAPQPLGRPNPATARLAEPSRLWVEESHGHLQARAALVSPQLLTDLQRGKVPPRAQVDLHGLTAEEARAELTRQVGMCRAEGYGCLLVVFGRGLHSGAGGPVLPDVVAQHLSEVLAEHVLAFCTAPRRWGGLGALLVCLKLASPSTD